MSENEATAVLLPEPQDLAMRLKSQHIQARRYGVLGKGQCRGAADSCTGWFIRHNPTRHGRKEGSKNSNDIE